MYKLNKKNPEQTNKQKQANGQTSIKYISVMIKTIKKKHCINFLLCCQLIEQKRKKSFIDRDFNFVLQGIPQVVLSGITLNINDNDTIHKSDLKSQIICTISKRNICYPSLQDKTTLCSPALRGGQFTFQAVINRRGELAENNQHGLFILP